MVNEFLLQIQIGFRAKALKAIVKTFGGCMMTPYFCRSARIGFAISILNYYVTVRSFFFSRMNLLSESVIDIMQMI